MSRRPVARPRLVELENRTTPATFAWNVDADGLWTDPANWLNQTTGNANDGFPVSSADTAIFGSKITAARTVTIPASVTITVGNLQFASAVPGGYTLASAGKLVLDAPTAPAKIDVTAGSHAISAPLTLNDDLLVVPASGTGLGFQGVVAESGGARGFTLDGPGQAFFQQTASNGYTGPTTVKNGTLQLALSGAGPRSGVNGPLIVGDGAGTAGSATLLAITSDVIADTSDVTVNGPDGVFSANPGSETVRSLTVNPGGSVSATQLTTTAGTTILGSDKDDVFTLTAASADGVNGSLNGAAIGTLKGAVTFAGGAGNDTLVGTDGADTFTLTDADAGAVNGVLAFGGVETANGGKGDDTFTPAEGKTFAGQIDGGEGANTLNYSAYANPVTVNLGANATTISGSLRPEEEVPPQSGLASGTFTITNYSLTKHTFDIGVSVDNLAPADVTGFHIHRGSPGVNGPVIVDLLPSGALTPNGAGFTFTAKGLTLPALQEAALLGGLTYVNIHTKAAPNGLIRGNGFNTAVFAAVTGAATGAASVVNVQNVTGGAGADSIVGNGQVNVLDGGAGDDAIVGAQGSDALRGGDGADALVWTNGDGTDVMDGGAGADTVQVNGSFDKGDTFTVGAGANGRVSFQRINLVPFGIDIGTAESLVVNGVGGDDALTVADLATATDLGSVFLGGNDGNDAFNVTQNAKIALTANGGLPAGTTPGDTLTVTPGSLAATGSTTNGSSTGLAVLAGGGSIAFAGMETLVGVLLNTNGAGNPFAVGPDAGGGATVRRYDLTGKATGTDLTAPDATGGVRVAVADVTGDGVADLIVGTGPGLATAVRVYNGTNNTLVLTVNPFESTFTGGVYVTGGDINGDGKAEVVITPDQGGGPRVRVFDGAALATGKESVIADYFGIVDPNFRGGARASVGDVNADGTPDVAVAAGFQGGPRVAVWSGKSLLNGGTPATLFNDFFAFEPTLRNGVYLTVGDENGDGYGDIIAGGGPGGGPRVQVFSGKDFVTSGGATMTVLANFFAGDPNNRGGVRLSTRDLDSDGRADIISGAGTGGGSRVTGYAAKNIPAQGTPTAVSFDFDAVPGFTGGVFVG